MKPAHACGRRSRGGEQEGEQAEEGEQASQSEKEKERDGEAHGKGRERAAADGGKQAPMGQHRSREKDAKSAKEFNSNLS
jgi:hypothetical protein